MPLPVVQVDAFTSEPFSGNPAAVCVLDGPREESWMRLIAREMNLSETAFLHPEGDGHRLRWFTPAVEVELCGHATLASAHVLWEEGHLAPDSEARFYTASGPLNARRSNGGAPWIEMDFPAERAEPSDPPAGLLEALLGLPADGAVGFIGRNRFDWLVEVGSEAAVRALRPDMTALEAVTERGVIVTARAAPGEPAATGAPAAAAAEPAADFVSRYFAPAVGVPEDPVTGSAHCCLGPYWSARLGRDALVGYQASERGGMVRVRTAETRVLLGGQAVTVLRGTLAEG